MSAIQSRRAVSVRDRIAIGESIKNAQNIVREIEGVDSELRINYEFLANKLSIKVKDHIKAMDVAHDQSQILYQNLGTIKYEGKPFYVKKIVGDSTDQFRTQLIYRKSSYSREIKKSLNFKDFKKRTQMLGFGSRVKARI